MSGKAATVARFRGVLAYDDETEQGDEFYEFDGNDVLANEGQEIIVSGHPMTADEAIHTTY